MKTKPGTGHRHKTKGGLWSDKTDEESGSLHVHEIDLATLTPADIAKLKAALVTPPPIVTPPPVTPPPVVPPVPVPPSPIEPPPAAGVVVESPAALLAALADDAVTRIVGKAGTWRLSGATYKAPDSLWIGKRFAARTNPVVVDLSAVVLDGAGATGFCALAFDEGAHHQSWIGVTIGNGTPTNTGAIIFGGYAGLPEPHHITLVDLKLLPTLHSGAAAGRANDHGIYFSAAAGYGHLIDGLDVDASASDGLDAAIHVYHAEPGSPNVRDTLIRRFAVKGGPRMQAVMMWEASAGLVLEDGLISNCTVGVRSEAGALTLRRVRTVDCGIGVSGSKAPVYDGCRYDVATRQLVLL